MKSERALAQFQPQPPWESSYNWQSSGLQNRRFLGSNPRVPAKGEAVKIRKKVKGSYLVKGVKACGYDDCEKVPGTRGRLAQEDRKELEAYYDYLHHYNQENDQQFVGREKPRLEK